MPDQTVTMTAKSLRRMLLAVLPATGRDDTLPVFQCVRLHMAQTALCATATDRYALAQARGEAAGTLPPVLVDREDVKRILRVMDWPDNVDRSIALSVGEGNKGQTLTVRHITVASDGMSVTVHTRDHRWPEDGLRKLAESVPTRHACGTDRPLAFDIWSVERLLRRLRRVGTRDRGSVWSDDKRRGYTVRVYVGRPPQPTRIECGDWFVAVVQPTDSDQQGTDYAAMAGVPLEFNAAGDRAAAGGGTGNPAMEDQPPPTPTETGADRG